MSKSDKVKLQQLSSQLVINKNKGKEKLMTYVR
jgi:hypothetical protein